MADRSNPDPAAPTTLLGVRRPVHRVRSRDRDQAREEISRIFSPHGLEIVGPTEDLDVRVRGWELSSMMLADIGHGTEVLVRPGRLESYYEINIPLRGTTVTSHGHDEIESTPGRAVVLSPTEPSTMRWSSDCTQIAIKINRAALDRAIEAVVGVPPDETVRFQVGLDLTDDSGRTWARTAALLRESLLQGAPEMVVRPLEEAVINGLLVAQPHSLTAQLDGRPRPAKPRAVARVQELIDADPSVPLTVADMARVSGTSVRSLQTAFAEHLGMSPSAYLRRARLARAHDDLIAAQPGDGQTVADIAYRWGFGHVPRFAAAYRQRYGAAPAQTLRR
jgi:AraC-like DNA-binding protein